jgi:hypothetical protein
MFLSVDGGRSQISSFGTSQWACRRHFLALMVGTLGSSAPAPPNGPAVNVCSLIVGAPESLSAPPRGPASTFSIVDGARSQIFSSGTS